MKGRRQRQQSLADEIEKEPGKQQPGQQLGTAENACKGGSLQERDRREFPQAGRANDLVIVLGDALAAKELGAFRTTRHRLALGMVEAALVGDAWNHGTIRGGAFGSSTT